MNQSGLRGDLIHLTGKFTDCIIGVYPNERHTKQAIAVTLEIECDTRQAARSSKLEQTLDYAKLVGEIGFILETSRFLLLETAADSLARYLLAPPLGERKHPRPTGVTIKLHKPEAISASFDAAIEIHRSGDDYSYDLEKTKFGTVDVIAEYKECGIYRLNVGPGLEIPTHVHKNMREREMALSDGLLLQGKPLKPGVAHSWPKDFPHCYKNPTAVPKTILCIDSPKFQRADEIPVNAQPTALDKLPQNAVKDYYHLSG